MRQWAEPAQLSSLIIASSHASSFVLADDVFSTNTGVRIVAVDRRHAVLDNAILTRRRISVDAFTFDG